MGFCDRGFFVKFIPSTKYIQYFLLSSITIIFDDRIWLTVIKNYDCSEISRGDNDIMTTDIFHWSGETSCQ